MARDARIGAIGAEPIRQLYWEGKTDEANQRAKELLKANTAGIALASGAASTSLLADLGITAGTTVIDTIGEGDSKNLAKNVAKNAIFDLLGHGIGKTFRAIDNLPIVRRMKSTFTGIPKEVLDNGNISTYNGTIWSTPSKGYAQNFAGDGKVYKVLVDPSELKMLEAPIPIKGTYHQWDNLPYTYKNGKFSTLPTAVIDDGYQIFSDPRVSYIHNYPKYAKKGEIDATKSLILRRHKGFENPKSFGPGISEAVRTDDIVEASAKDGFSGVHFYDIWDGHTKYKNRSVLVPIDEAVYNPHAPHWILSANRSKWSLLFKDLNKLKIKKHGGKLTK